MKESVKTVATLGEFGLINTLFAPLQKSRVPGVVLGIGDDAASLALPNTQHLLTTSDMLVEGVHFNSDTDPFLLGQKSLCVNLSDMAAMGGTPRWYLLSLALPASTPLSWAEEFVRGLDKTTEAFEIALIGGDTVASLGCVTITITMLGWVGKGRAVTRSGAQPGDRVFVSGSIGDATLGLAQRTGRLQVTEVDDLIYLKHRHQCPEPRVELARMLQEAGIVHAAIDVSDGLIADLEHLCEDSGVGAHIHKERVPHSDAARRVLKNHGPEVEALLLTGGEDYELLFTAPPVVRDQISALSKASGVPITEIGEITTDAPRVVVLDQNGLPFQMARGGWSHF